MSDTKNMKLFSLSSNHEIAQKIAELTGLETKKIEEITTQNALNLFNLQCENV